MPSRISLSLIAVFLICCSSNCLFPADSVNVTILGDTYFGESYQFNPAYNHGTNFLEKHGYDYMFSSLGEILQYSDFTFLNFEASLGEINKFSAPLKFEYVHYSNADSVLFYFNKYHINACGLANNHSFDLGYSGLDYMVKHFEKHNVITFGAGSDIKNASKPLHKQFTVGSKEIDLFVIGCYWPRKAFEELGDFYATSSNGGVNKLDPEMIAEQVKEIRKVNSNAFIVVYPHWGNNYKQKNSWQESAAHKLVDAGADLIIGHGAHTIQEIETYHGKLIFYNIGNFVFGAPGRYKQTEALPYGLIVNLLFKNDGNMVLLTPIYTDNLASGYLPRVLNKTELDECILTAVKKDSLRGSLSYPTAHSFSIQLN